MSDSRKRLSHPAQKRYPAELGSRPAHGMVLEMFEAGQRRGVIGRVARQLGVGTETLRNWVNQAEIDGGAAAGVDGARTRRRMVGAGGRRTGSCAGRTRFSAHRFGVLRTAADSTAGLK